MHPEFKRTFALRFAYLQSRSYAHIPTLVPIICNFVAAGVVRSGDLSVCMAGAVAVSNRRHCGGRSASPGLGNCYLTRTLIGLT